MNDDQLLAELAIMSAEDHLTIRNLRAQVAQLKAEKAELVDQLAKQEDMSR